MSDKPTRTEIALNTAHRYNDESLDEVKWECTLNQDEFGQVKIKYQDLRKLLINRYKLGWSSGACYMLASVDIDNKRKK